MDRTNQFILHFFLFICLLVLGAAGYMVIEGWSFMDALYMTVITLATVGYGEVHEISPKGRLFTVILIFLGVGFFLYVVGTVIQFLVEGRIRHVLGRRMLDKQISKLKIILLFADTEGWDGLCAAILSKSILMLSSSSKIQTEFPL